MKTSKIKKTTAIALNYHRSSRIIENKSKIIEELIMHKVWQHLRKLMKTAFIMKLLVEVSHLRIREQRQ
jgi:hypothetical protein